MEAALVSVDPKTDAVNGSQKTRGTLDDRHSPAPRHTIAAAMLDIHDWIAGMRPDQRVLDVGSGAGSFPGASFCCKIVTLDEDPAVRPAVCARADAIPFANASFDLIVCHHALEHIDDIDTTLAEMARVLTPSGRCFFSFPNGYGFCDAIYRYVFEGGGHVNRLRKDQTVRLIEDRLGVRLVRWQKLYSSFAYLRRLMDLLRDPPPGLQPRLLAIGRLPRQAIAGFQHLCYLSSRLIDSITGTGLSVYGWALFFERQPATPPDQQPGFINVCIYCGMGQPAATASRRLKLLCRCSSCGRSYPFVPPRRDWV
jgi:SAM-dependent methyltransferase